MVQVSKAVLGSLYFFHLKLPSPLCVKCLTGNFRGIMFFLFLLYSNYLVEPFFVSLGAVDNWHVPVIISLRAVNFKVEVFLNAIHVLTGSLTQQQLFTKKFNNLSLKEPLCMEY